MPVNIRDLEGFAFIYQPRVFDAAFCGGRCPPRSVSDGKHRINDNDGDDDDDEEDNVDDLDDDQFILKCNLPNLTVPLSQVPSPE